MGLLFNNRRKDQKMVDKIIREGLQNGSLRPKRKTFTCPYCRKTVTCTFMNDNDSYSCKCGYKVYSREV